MNIRKPTSTGQKLPDGYTGSGKRAATTSTWRQKVSLPRMLGMETKNKVPYEETPGTVYADKGAKRVPVCTSGQEKDNLTAFLDFFCST